MALARPAIVWLAPPGPVTTTLMAAGSVGASCAAKAKASPVSGLKPVELAETPVGGAVVVVADDLAHALARALDPRVPVAVPDDVARLFGSVRAGAGRERERQLALPRARGEARRGRGLVALREV